MNAPAPGRILRIKVSYRVKVPLFALTLADSFAVTIPRGSLIESLPRDPSDPPDDHTRVRWLHEDYLVSDAELHQGCERFASRRDEA